MKRKVKKIWLLLFVFCLFGNVMFVQAADDQLGMVVDGSVLTNQSEVSGSTLSNARGTYLASGNAVLTDKGNHVVNVSGATSCYKTCDEVRVILYLQRLVNGTWTSVTTLGPKSAYNDHYVSKSGNVTVTGGYYYRIKGTHIAIKGSTTETTSSSTNGLWISK